MTVPTPDPATSLNLSRTYPAPRELVFSAWTDPNKLKQWWAAQEGFTTPIAEVDLRVGGQYRLGMKPPDQNVIYVVSGTYREVSVPEKLVYTWVWEAPLDAESMLPSDERPPEMESMVESNETLVTVEFRAQGDSTEIVLTHEYFADEPTRDEHRHGWSGVMERLAQVIAAGRV
jgi:uncharacterized protein YndB with AHSA1/START domain